MEKEIAIAIATGFIGLFTFLVKSYFSTIKKEMRMLHSAIDKLDGRLEDIRGDLRENTIENVKLNSELKAIWRYIDAPQRSTDARANS